MGASGGTGPLAGVRVVELGVWVAGPAAGGIMADWGADVIKVEPAGGDPQRALFGSVGFDGSIPVPPFEVDNRGKRSMVPDLRDFDDHAEFDRLLSTADVCGCDERSAPYAVVSLIGGVCSPVAMSEVPRMRSSRSSVGRVLRLR